MPTLVTACRGIGVCQCLGKVVVVYGGGGLLVDSCWHAWVNHSHCCLGSRPQQCAPNRTVGDRRQFTGPVSNTSSPLYTLTASFPCSQQFSFDRGCQQLTLELRSGHCEVPKQFLKWLLFTEANGAQPAVSLTDGCDTHTRFHSPKYKHKESV